MTPAERLAQIRERLAQATPGPWEYLPGKVTSKSCEWTAVLQSKSGRLIFSIPVHPKKITFINGQDMEFIAHAPTDLAWLLDRMAKMERVADAARHRLEVWTRETAQELQDALAKLDKEETG